MGDDDAGQAPMGKRIEPRREFWGQAPTQSPEINELATALAKAQADIKVAPKNASNPFFNSKYADLQGVWDCCREPLTKNGLSVIMGTEEVPALETQIVVVGTLFHSSGQWKRERLTLNLQPDKRGNITPQSTLSALTYGRRGLLAAMVGVVPGDDDDANYASGNAEQEAPTEQPTMDMSPLARLHKFTGLEQDVLLWWLVDEQLIDVDEAGDPGQLQDEVFQRLLKNKGDLVMGPCARWQGWVALCNAKRLAKKDREPLRQYCQESDLFGDTTLKRPDAWSNLKPSVVAQASERWSDLLKSFKKWQQNKEEN